MKNQDWVSKYILRTSGWRGRFIGMAMGAMAVLGQAPFHLWPLAILSLALLLARLKYLSDAGGTFKNGFSAAFWHGFGYFLAGTYWIGSAFIARGPEFIPVMPPMILALGALLAFFWGVAGGVFVKIRPAKMIFMPAFVSLFFLAEFIRGHIFGGFPWNLVGYVFEAGRPISQFAAFGGIYGLTCVVFILAALLYGALMSRRAISSWVLIAVLIGGLWGAGYWRLSQAKTEFVEGVNLRITHVRFEQKDKFDRQEAVNIVNDFITQSVAPGIEDITHLIWPEGAVNGLVLENESLMRVMGRELSLVDKTPPIWLLNSLRNEQRPNPVNGGVINDYYNTSAAVSFTAEGVPAIAALNDKQKLVPFGEFIPGGKWMEARNVPVISTSLLSISAAKTKTLAVFPGLPKLSPQICYEIIFSGFTPHPQNEAKAEWILNQSNDAWYGNSIGPMQHANMSRYRAIEEGLPVIRAASNGISAVIDPYGRYKSFVTPFETRFIDAKLPKFIEKRQFIAEINRLLFLITLLISLCCTTIYYRTHGRPRN